MIFKMFSDSCMNNGVANLKKCSQKIANSLIKVNWDICIYEIIS